MKRNEPKSAQSSVETPSDSNPIAVASEAVKRRTGRPSIDEMYKELDASTGNQASGASTQTPPADYVTEQDRQMFRETAKSVTVLVDVLAVSIFQNQMTSLGYPKNDIVEFCAQIPMKPELREQFVSSGTVLAEKYGFIKIGPEAAFIGAVVIYSYSLMELKKSVVLNAPTPPRPTNVETMGVA